MASFPQDLPAGASLSPPSVALSEPGWFKKIFLTKRFLFFSILGHLLLGLGASVYIVQTINAKSKATFTAASAPSAPAASREHKVRMQKKQQTLSAPAQMKRVTTTATNTRVALPQMPMLPTHPNNINTNKNDSIKNNGVGFALGGGSGGTGGGSGRPVSLFGLHTAGSGALVGTLYDFKQTAEGKPTNQAIADQGSMSPLEKKPNDENHRFVGQFANANFSEGMVENYFKGPQPLYAPQVFIPPIPSESGPSEFGLGDKVVGRRWGVVYRGKVTAPESGSYHFVGLGDDYMIVRFQGRLVLDGSLTPPTGKRPLKEYTYAGMDKAYHFAESDPVQVIAGEQYEVKVLIGEQPGFIFCAMLLLEKEGVKYETDPSGAPILPVFKVGPCETNRTAKGAPATMPDQSWSVWKALPP